MGPRDEARAPCWIGEQELEGLRAIVIGALLVATGCEKSAQEKVAEYQLAEIKGREERARKEIDRYSGMEDDLEKRMSFECPQELRKQRETPRRLEPGTRAVKRQRERSLAPPTPPRPPGTR